MISGLNRLNCVAMYFRWSAVSCIIIASQLLRFHEQRKPRPCKDAEELAQARRPGTRSSAFTPLFNWVTDGAPELQRALASRTTSAALRSRRVVMFQK